MSAKLVSMVELTVSEEAAQVIKALLFALNWDVDQFQFAQQLVDELSKIGIEEASLEYNEEAGQFDPS